MTAWEKILDFTLREEGGISDNPHDPGGHTDHGISSVFHPGVAEKIKSPEERADWYHREFWMPCKCDMLPSAVAAVVFDFAVNSGPGDAIRALQAAVGSVQDGAIGPKTLHAVYVGNALAIARDVIAWRIVHQSQCPSWIHHHLGWSRRNLRLFLFAAELAKEA